MITLRFRGESPLRSHLAAVFAKELAEEKRVLLVDTWVGDRRQPIAFGVENECIYDLYDYLGGGLSLYKAAIETSDLLHIVPGPPEGKPGANPQALKELIEEAAEEYDVLILDASPEFEDSIGSEAEELVICTSEGMECPEADYIVVDVSNQKKDLSQESDGKTIEETGRPEGALEGKEQEADFTEPVKPSPRILGYIAGADYSETDLSDSLGSGAQAETLTEVFRNYSQNLTAQPPKMSWLKRLQTWFRT